MVFFLDFQSHVLKREDGLRVLELLTIGLPFLLHLRDQCRILIFKRNLKKFLGKILLCWFRVYILNVVLNFC